MKKSIKNLIKKVSALIVVGTLALFSFTTSQQADQIKIAENHSNYVQVSNTETTTTVTLDDIPIPLITTPMLSYTGWNAQVIQSRLRFKITSTNTDDYSVDLKLVVPYFRADDNAYMYNVVNLWSWFENRSLPIFSNSLTPTQIKEYWNSTIDTSSLDNENNGFYYTHGLGSADGYLQFRGNMYNLIYNLSSSYGGDYFTLRGDLSPVPQAVIDEYGQTVGTFFTAYLEKPTSSNSNSFNVSALQSITINYYSSNYAWRTDLVRTIGDEMLIYNQFTEYVFSDGMNSMHFVFPTFNQPIFEQYPANVNDVYSYTTTYYITDKESDNENVYNNGYQDGYNSGLNTSQENSYNNGYQQGYDNGFTEGENKGYNEGISENNTFASLMFSVVDAPVQIFTSLLDFEVLGVNMSQFALSLLSMALLIAILRFIL